MSIRYNTDYFRRVLKFSLDYAKFLYSPRTRGLPRKALELVEHEGAVTGEKFLPSLTLTFSRLPQTSSCGGLKELFTKVILLFLFHSELTAFISESRAGYDDSKCTLKEDGIGFELAGLAFALQKNSSWTASISRAIHKLKAQDTITEIFNKWTTSRCKTSQQSVVAHRMGLDEFEGFLFNTAMITLGCFLILLLEVFFYRRITRARRSFSPEQNGTALNAAKLPRVSTTND